MEERFVVAGFVVAGLIRTGSPKGAIQAVPVSSRFSARIESTVRLIGDRNSYPGRNPRPISSSQKLG
eukprot:2969434-Rhodomonas_salina.1